MSSVLKAQDKYTKGEQTYEKIDPDLNHCLLVSTGVVQAQCESPDGTVKGLILSGFYECKQQLTPGAVPNFWQEVTTLMLVNQNPHLITTSGQVLGGVIADILFFDGNEKAIARTETLLSGYDLDEINVCESLLQGGVPVPSAGMIRVRLHPTWTDPAGNTFFSGDPELVSGWMKNVVGQFKKGNPEPFAGKVAGVGKTRMDLKCVDHNYDPDAKGIKPILIEGTAD